MTGARPPVPGRAASTQGADSAGQTWHERSLSSTGFDDDRGEADPAVLDALRTGGADDAHLVGSVATSRLLVAVVAEPTRLEAGRDGLVHDASVDMALVVLTVPDGTRALPAFTSLESLSQWDPSARPVPVTAARAAQAAVSESCGVIVVDVGSDHETTLRPSMVWALAQQRDWLPAHEDPFVARSVEVAVGPEPDVIAHELDEGEPVRQGILRVALTLRPGLTGEEVREVATRVGERLAADGELRARVDGLVFALR